MYKLIPNEKKTDYNIDDWIQKPPKKDNKEGKVKLVKPKKIRSILEISAEVEFFCSNAYAQNYLVPNHSIPKKERPKWRFLVKRLYKEILDAIDAGNHPLSCANELLKLYKVLTYSCHWQLFRSYDSFESVGIGQLDFFGKIVNLYRNHKDLNDFVSETIRLIIDNPLNRYTLHSGLINGFIDHCNTPDLLDLCIQQAEITRNEVLLEPDKVKVFYSSFKQNKGELSYEKREKINILTQIGFKARVKLFEYETAIAYFNEQHIERSKEVKLYILVSLLFQYRLKDHIKNEIERNIAINPRKALLDLLHYIKENNDLPNRF
jgi:hypothetical protein